MTAIRTRSRFLWSGAVVLLGLVASLDVLTGSELSFSIFYLAPVSLVAWQGNRARAVAVALVAAAVWMTVDLFNGVAYSNDAIRLWNASVRFGFFAIVGYMLATLRELLNVEQRLADTDGLTGALNARALHETLTRECARMRRFPRPLTLVYVDIDNFKAVNDQLGHAAGDELLCQAVRVIQNNTRLNDVLARLGGDEFVLVLPETDQQGALACVEKLRGALMDRMAARSWPVTVSIGVVSFLEPLQDVAEMVRRADDVMYKAKRSGKNRVKEEIIGTPSEGGAT